MVADELNDQTVLDIDGKPGDLFEECLERCQEREKELRLGIQRWPIYLTEITSDPYRLVNVMTKVDKSMGVLFNFLKIYFICGFNVYLGNLIWLKMDGVLALGHLVPAIFSFRMQQH